MKIAISIKNYERKEMLLNLLSEINEFKQKNPLHDIFIDIWDDKSNFDKEFLQSLISNYSVNQPKTHLGKELHWKLWNYNLHNDSLKRDVDLFIYVPSDYSKLNLEKIISLAGKLKDKEYVFNVPNCGRLKCWNQKEPIKVNEEYSQYFFTDCAFFTNYKTLSKIGFYVNPINKSRFKNPKLSSGVGQQFTNRLNALKIPMYTPKESLCFHGNHESTMHKHHRLTTPLVTRHKVISQKKVIIGIATIFGREKALQETLNSLLNQTIQFDEIYVYNNAKREIDLTDNGKFEPLSRLNEPCYYFSCDDDLIYSETYIEDMIRAIQEHKCIVTHHGRKLLGKGRSYFTGHTQFGCLRVNRSTSEIDVAGTGVTAFDTEYFLPAEIYKSNYKRMADCVFSLEAAKQKKKIMILSHELGYIKQIPVDKGTSCFEMERRNPFNQRDIADSIVTLKNIR
jgi:hypothetical protein